MQRQSIRMYAEAIAFDVVKVYLSKGYYNGISPKFYIKDTLTTEQKLLHGDMGQEENGFNTYLLHDSVILGRSYVISDAYGLTCYVDFSPIALTKEFDDLFYYDGDDLGAHYTPGVTTFKVWSPLSTEVTLKVFRNGTTLFFPMKREEKGVYSAKVFKDLDNWNYLYEVKMNEDSVESCDPYAYASTANMASSVVIDLNKVKPKKYPLKAVEHYTDAIIYEVGVRDFSMDGYGGLRHKGKFLAFSETGNKTVMGHSTGVDYLEKLGITHVQLMPINDFATVDEDHPYDLYNWGYDPAQYNVTEGSYVTLPNDGYRRIRECQEMIDNLHRHCMRVIIDVVYNHMHDVNKNTLEKTCPYYFFRRDENGNLSNGSWCGNDLNSKGKMCRKYILDTLKRWQVLYGADGFRMDLMGIVDIETVNMILAQGKKIDPSFMLYGEGWNMGTAIPENERTTIENNHQTPGVGFFNDHFRDTLRGNNQIETKGYVSGDTYKTNEAIICMADYQKFYSIEQNLNYIECHDNATMYDKINVSNVEENDLCKERRCLMGIGMTIFAQGIPFLHAGQEFFDTKQGNNNSYNAGDMVNQLDWGRRDRYIEVTKDVALFIKLRKNNKCFRMFDYDDMRAHLEINNLNHRMIEYHVWQDEGEYRDFRIYFNPSYDKIDVEIDDDYKVLYCMENESIVNRHMTVTGVSMVICAR